MELLGTREEMVDIYVNLAGQATLRSRLETLPSHLCARIVDGHDWSDPARDFTGTDESAALRTLKTRLGAAPPLRIPLGIERCVLERVGLAALDVASIRGKRLALLEAALELAQRAPVRVGRIISAVVGMVCWLRPRERGVAPVSSTSFYEFPHCVFLTDLGARHVAPDVVFPAPTPYALLDNIYHEALHQQLIVTMLRTPFLEQAASSATVDVPWRQERWAVEHALHALLVYRRLVELRRAMSAIVPTDLAPIIERACIDAEACAQTLRASLLQQPSTFTPAGIAFCASL